MSNKTRKHIWPVALMPLVVAGVLAVVVALSAAPQQTAQAHDCEDLMGSEKARCLSLHERDGVDHDADGNGNGNGNGDTPRSHTGKIYSDSSSASAAPEFRLAIDSLKRDLPVGSSIVLFLEADYGMPSSIPPGSIYFVATGGDEAEKQPTKTGNGARVKATASVRIDTDNYFDKNPNDSDARILVEIPDMCTSSTDDCQGPNGPFETQMLTMVIEDSSGIKNPSEGETNYRVAFSVLGPTESPPGVASDRMINPERVNSTGGSFEPAITNGTLRIAAKISLSDNSAKRDYEMTISGTGFNNGTTGTAFVRNTGGAGNMYKWDVLDCAEMKAAVMGKTPAPLAANTDGSGYCKMYGGLDADRKAVVDLLDFSGGYAEAALCDAIIRGGSELGGGLVGSDDTVSVAFTVAVPTFKAGGNNWVCMKDGENRRSVSDVENFFLEDSLRAVPSTVSAGDTVTLFAEDFMTGLTFIKLQLDGKDAPAAANVSGTGIRLDGSATVTFKVPGSIGSVPLQGTIKVEGFWGDDKADSKITVAPATLTLSKTTALPNDTITIQGVGFGDSPENDIALAEIKIDDVPLAVDDDSRDGGEVTVSSAGQFVATVYLWQASGTSNPALTAGTHTIKVKNKAGFTSTATITIPEPTVKVMPDVAGPRNYVEISGENWPVDNPESIASVDTVSVTITEGSRQRRYSAIPDSAGRWTVEHRVGSAVAIPSTNQVKVEYGSDIAKVASFQVPEATITVEPGEAQPGDRLTLAAFGMPVHASVDEIKIGGRVVSGGLNFNTNRAGNVTATGVIVPGLDPGTYGVEMKINDIVAIGSLKVLPEGPAGIVSPLPGAVTNLGDRLERVFHFNGVDKTWSFFDPRTDFADLNTLTELVEGEPYWILVSEGVDDVVLNDKTRMLSCVGGDCWNQLVW